MSSNRAEKSHWYCFVFVGQHVDTGLDVTANTLLGLYAKIGEELLTVPDIAKAKALASVTDTAALVNILYLGYGSRAAFQEKEENA